MLILVFCVAALAGIVLFRMRQDAASLLGARLADSQQLADITAQERHLYRMLQEEMHDLETLRMARHDARNQLTMLQGFLERGETEQALDYVRELTRSTTE